MKKYLLTAVQIAVTLGVLWWVFHDPTKRAAMVNALRNADKGWIFAALLAYGAVEVLASIRFEILLRVQGIRLGFLRAGALTMIGVFFNLFLLGATGGDVFKVFLLLKETPPGKAATAFLAVLMDRLVGLLALITISGIFVGLRYQWLQQTPGTAQLSHLLILILAGGVVGVVVSFIITGFHLVHKLPARLPGHDKLVELSAAYNLYGRAWRTSSLAFALSIVAHLGYFVIFYFTARAFDAPARLYDFMAIMPIINTITALPISVAGLGLREKLFEDLLGQLCAVPEAVAVLTSVAGFCVVVFWSLIGGLIYLFYRPTQRTPLREIRHEVEEIEHDITHP